MKKTLKQQVKESLKVTVDPSLDEKYKDQILFPEKLRLAQERIDKYGLPPLNSFEDCKK